MSDAETKWPDAGDAVTPDRLRLAEEVMSIVTPVLESYGRQVAALAARVAVLEGLAEELIGEWKPYPRPDSTGFYRAPAAVPGSAVARWRGVLEGEG